MRLSRTHQQAKRETRVTGGASERRIKLTPMLSRSVKLGGCPIPIGGNRWRTVSKSRWQGAGTPSRHIMRATSGADGNTRVTGNESALRDAQGNTDSDDKTREASTSGSSVASGENSQKRDDGSHNSEGPVWRKIATRIVHTAVGVLASIARGIAKLVPQPVAEAFAKVMSVIRPILPVLVFAGFFFASNAGRAPGPREVMYSDFASLVKSNSVASAQFETSSNRIYFTLKPQSAIMQQLAKAEAEAAQAAKEKRMLRSPRAERIRQMIFEGERASATSQTAAQEASPATASEPQAAQAPPAATSSQGSKSRSARQFYTIRVPESDPELVATLRASNVRFGAVSPSLGAAVSKVLLTLVALWVPLLPMFLIFQRQFGGRDNRRKGQGKNGPPQKPPVTFADVAGVPSAKEELLEAVMCLRDASRYSKLNAQMPSGVLLVGPPGTGKTLLAKAVAGEAGTPAVIQVPVRRTQFFSASASEFVEMYVGRGAARVRELFAEARKAAPSVVFIDELDAVGARRGMGFNEERDQTLNQLLTELDGFEGRPGVLVLAATNRPDTLDPALLRPGRLTRRVTVPLPDEAGRRDILMVHLARVPVVGVAREEAAELLAKVTPNCSGAELANVVNEGALMAGRKGNEHVGLEDLLEGVQRTRFGVDGSRRGVPQWATNLMQSLAAAGNRKVAARNAF